jgi:hypothetical protein
MEGRKQLSGREGQERRSQRFWQNEATVGFGRTSHCLNFWQNEAAD